MEDHRFRILCRLLPRHGEERSTATDVIETTVKSFRSSGSDNVELVPEGQKVSRSKGR